MKIHRFFVSNDISVEKVMIRDEKVVHQIAHVLRMKVGEVIALCDGGGVDARGNITRVNDGEIEVHITERVPAWVPEKKIKVFLAPIRKERFEWALEKCTEIGASGFVPLITERSERGIVKTERAETIIREAAEQCGRGDLPNFDEPIDIQDLTGEYFVLDMGEPSLGNEVKKSKEIRLLIGPEGGWTDAERAFFNAQGFRSFSLGPTTLRAETAAVVACAKVV